MTIKKLKIEKVFTYNSKNIDSVCSYNFNLEEKINEIIDYLNGQEQINETEKHLLPCPFCGSAGILKNPLNGTWGVYCTNTNCYIPSLHYSEKEAIKAWNNRHD